MLWSSPYLKNPASIVATNLLEVANFRPISKLPFMSKILEKVVYAQHMSFVDDHNVLEVFQSGFKTLHSTESALLRGFNDILLANDSGEHVLVLLDLTAAFDSMDHNVLAARLRHLVGICGTALEWFKSYLSDRSITVSLGKLVWLCSTFVWGSTGVCFRTPAFFFVFAAPGFNPKETWHLLPFLS